MTEINSKRIVWFSIQLIVWWMHNMLSYYAANIKEIRNAAA